MRDRTWVLLIALGVLVADQVTKLIVVAQIPQYSRIELIDNFLALTHVRNSGAAFGLFADAPPGPVRVVLVVISALAVGLIWAYAREGWHERKIVVAFGHGFVLAPLVVGLVFGFEKGSRLAHGLVA